MTLIIVLLSALTLSVAFHFVGVYAGAKKTVWLMIVLMWAAAINISMSEVKPKGYAEIEKMKGKYKELDVLIGTSRKSFISRLLGENSERLSASLATIGYTYEQGAKYFRVHDVKESVNYLKKLYY